MANEVEAATVKRWLSDGGEIAFLDVREHGQYGEGHPFFAVPVPYSVLELRLPQMVPNLNARIVLLDEGDGVAKRAALRAEALGYGNVSWVKGGAAGWRRAGFTLFAGVNVPSKTFGELIEHRRHTPRITAIELDQLKASGEPFVIVDGRPFAEFQKMNIPGGICCPNGEMALRIGEVVRDPNVRIVVNCAGRTRSIIGAETLLALGLPNPISALENGTQGWFLAGLDLERGRERMVGNGRPSAGELEARRVRLRALAERRGARFTDAKQVADWLTALDRTTYLLDVRSPEEHAARAAPLSVSAPGGQLIQATDQWVGVKGGRLVLIDDDGVRAPMVAQWLAQLGHETWVLDGGVDAAMGLSRPAGAKAGLTDLREVSPAEVKAMLAAGARLIDLRSSAAFKAGHVAGAEWSIRPRLASVKPVEVGARVIVAGHREEVAIAAVDLSEAGWGEVVWLAGEPKAWAAAALDVRVDEGELPDTARIDYLFFVHDRHDGNADAARRYLEWETGLLAQLDEQERGVFRIVD